MTSPEGLPVQPAAGAGGRTSYTPKANARITVRHDGKIRGFDLPDRSDGAAWANEAVRWWESTRRAPQAKLMRTSDWELLLIAVDLLHKMYTEVETTWQGATVIRPVSPQEFNALAGQFRQYTEQYGLTFAARQKHNINVVEDRDALEEAEEILAEHNADLPRQEVNARKMYRRNNPGRWGGKE